MTFCKNRGRQILPVALVILMVGVLSYCPPVHAKANWAALAEQLKRENDKKQAENDRKSGYIPINEYVANKDMTPKVFILPDGRIVVMQDPDAIVDGLNAMAHFN